MLWPVIPAFTIALLVVFWCGIMATIARMSGWNEWGQRYRTKTRPAGTTYRLQSARVGWIDYSGCLTMVVGETGFYLAVFPVFAFAHPPLLFPWTELTLLSLNKSWFVPTGTLQIGGPTGRRLRIPQRIVDEAATHLAAAAGIEAEFPPGDGGN